MYRQSFDAFSELIRSNFSFLKSYNFSCQEQTESCGTYVYFLSESIKIFFCYGAPEYEVSMSFEFKGEDKCISFGELLGTNMFDWKYATPQREYTKNEIMSLAINSFKSFLIKNIDKILSSEKQILRQIHENREKLLNTEKLMGNRIAAEHAWNDGAWNDVVKFYKTIQDDLTELELKRMRYSEKKILDNIRIK